MKLQTPILSGCVMLLSACVDIKSDPAIPESISSSKDMTGELGPEFNLVTLTQGPSRHMTVADLDSGKFQLRPNGQVWNFTRPIDWAADPFNDLNWRYKFNSWSMIGPYLSAYDQTGDEAAFRKAVDIILDWQYFHQDLAQTTSVSWVDMVSGQRAARLAWVISEAELNSGLIADAQLSNLIRLADFHVQRMQGPGYMADNNHGIFDALGLLAMCETLDKLPSCAAASAKGQQRLQEIFFHQFAEDGGQKEHSPSYHYLGINMFRKVFDTGVFDFTDEMRLRWNKALSLRPWFLDGTGQVPAIGDSERKKLFKQRVTCLEGDAGCVQAAFLPQTGYGLVHNITPESDGHGSLMMSCSFHSYIHKHLDELSFEWAEQGQHILVDSGKYSYDNDKTRHYMLSRVAHNSVKVQDERFTMDRKTFPGPCLEDMQTIDGNIKLHGRFAIPGTDITHSREVNYLPGHSVSVRDTLTDSAKFPKQLWHFASDFDVTLGETMSASNANLIIDITPPRGCKAEAVKGQEGRDYQGWVATGYRKRVAATTLIFSCPSSTSEIVTSFKISESQFSPKKVSITKF